jgi:hypothetical protein
MLCLIVVPLPPGKTPFAVQFNNNNNNSLAISNVQKAHAFVEHLAEVFQLHPSENLPKEEESLIQLLETPYQIEPPINHLKRTEIKEVVNSLNPKKSSGYDLITGNILKEFPIN